MNTKRQTAERKKIEDVIMSLMKELEKMAPHPDSVLGRVLLEGFLGAAFIKASAKKLKSLTQSLSKNFSNIIDPSADFDFASKYIQNHYNIKQKKAITTNFNKNIIWKNMMQAYLSDLPKRLGIERWLAGYQRKIYALQKHQLAPAI